MPGASRPDERIPIALTIAGSDSSGGAGIQADLKTFHLFGVYGTSVVTAVTAQNTKGISAIHPVPPDIVAEQYLQAMSDIGAGAVKTGMLVGGDTVAALAQAFDEYPPENLVVDPVLASGTGFPLMDPSAISALLGLIIRRATLVTPNLEEAAALTGSRPIQSLEDMARAAEEIQQLGPQAVLVKGGHLQLEEEAVDILRIDDTTAEFRNPRLDTPQVHGTGCSLSAAITAGLAKGLSVFDSVAAAKEFITQAIANSLGLGKGAKLISHLPPGKEG